MSKFTPDEWQALSPRLDEVLGLTDEERSVWFSTLRDENPALAQQLETLLQEHRELSADGFLEVRKVELPPTPGLAGQIFGVYTLISQIGRGGMGTVWLARRNDGRFERRFAVKVLNIALMGKGGEERFKREGRILGRLTHPHIAELIDAGVSPSGQPFLVLEYVEGDHIDRYCDEHSLDVRARIRLFLDALRAVEMAHSNLIVHRDLKPSNILVRTDGQAKLLDFGIAKLLESDGEAGESTLTREGGRAMTPEYAAPEQLRGEAVTAATDVYASGVLLYVLLTGRHPAGTGPHTPASLLKAILEIEASRPSEIVAPTRTNSGTSGTNARKRATTPDKLSRTLRGDLDTIVAKALKKNSQERYASIKELADDLQRYLKYEPISARPDAFTYRAGKFLRRHRTSAIAAGVVMLALAGTAIFNWYFPPHSQPLPQYKQRKLTANVSDSPVYNAAISPDGKYLGYADWQGIHLQTIATGGVQSVAQPPGIPRGTAKWSFGDWYPDSNRFLVSVRASDATSTIWSIPTAGGEAEKLAEVEDMLGGGRISPDGLHIAYQRLRSGIGAREIWVMGSRGESPRKIYTAESQATMNGIGWSPAGDRIAYGYRRDKNNRTEIMVQSCDLNGGKITTIVRDNHLSDFMWMRSGRFIYSRNTEPGSAESDNLREMIVDGKSGVAQGKAHLLTDWSGFSAYDFSSTADGKQLAFLRGNDHASVFVGDLTSKERHLVNTRRLTPDDNYNLPSAWTSDSREVLFSSERGTGRLMYRQALDPGSSAQLIAPATDTNLYLARLSPDRAWILLEGGQAGTPKMGLYRVDPRGGVPQRILDFEGFVLFSCSNKAANLCVIGRPATDKSELVVAAFDPIAGPGKELIRIPLEAGKSADIGFDYWWELSPDGTWIGITKKHGHEIRLVPLHGGPTRTITVTDYPDLMELSWATDSRSMFVSTLDSDGASLLSVATDGDTQLLWHQPHSTHMWGNPSPDGRHLAIMVSNKESNAWIIGNFDQVAPTN